MIDQLQILIEILGILLGVLVDVQKGLVELCSGSKDRYHVINVDKGSRSDGCFCKRRDSGVRHARLDESLLGCERQYVFYDFDVAVVIAEEDTPPAPLT